MKDHVMSRERQGASPSSRPTPATVLLGSGVPIRRTPAALARRFAQICLAVVAESLAGEGVTPLQYAALAYLNDEPDIDQNALAARLGVEQSHGSLLVEQLVMSGLVERRVNGDDRRARMIRPTARGAKLYQRLRPGARARQNRMLSPLTPAERDVFLDQLVRIVIANEVYARPGAGRRKRGSRQLSSSKTRSGSISSNGG
jgi:DNA-binding MarR family transcriptional regulator